MRDLLAGFEPPDLHGCVITLDAMHTQNETAKTILDAGADYVFTVKANRPTLLAALRKLPWAKVPRGSQSTQRGHGRRATGTIKVIEVPDLPGWPEFGGAAQVAQLRRTVTTAGKKTPRGGLPDHLDPTTTTHRPRPSLPGFRATGASRTPCTRSATCEPNNPGWSAAGASRSQRRSRHHRALGPRNLASPRPQRSARRHGRLMLRPRERGDARWGLSMPSSIATSRA